MGPEMSLFRQYSSFSANNTRGLYFNGMFGNGWRTDYDANLMEDGSFNVTIVYASNRAEYYQNNSGTYTPSPGTYSTLVHNTDGSYTVTDKHGIKTHYISTGMGSSYRVDSRTDRNGNSLTFVYAPTVANATYIEDAAHRKITFIFNSDNPPHITDAYDPTGKHFQYGYDTNGNLTSITDPTSTPSAPVVTTYHYDSNNFIDLFTNSNSHERHYHYNSSGQADQTWQNQDENGGYVNNVSLAYSNQYTTVTDSLQHNEIYTFDSSGLLRKYQDRTGAIRQFNWDLNFNKTSETDAATNVTSYGYDGKGNLTQITDPYFNITSLSYTPDFNLISNWTDPLQHGLNFSYDARGNLTGILDSMGDKHSFVYDQYGNRVQAMDSRGNVTNFTFDALGHILQETDALGDVISLTYE